jgi:hypothetical protein
MFELYMETRGVQSSRGKLGGSPCSVFPFRPFPFNRSSFRLENYQPVGIPMNANISIKLGMFILTLPLVEKSQINFTMTLNFDLENVWPVEIPMNPNINIELSTFQSVPQVEMARLSRYSRLSKIIHQFLHDL